MSDLPTLKFQHRFKNGLVVDLIVTRKEFTPPVFTASMKDFQTPEIEKEYLKWSREIALRLINDSMITPGEMCALAIQTALKKRKNWR